MILPRPFLLAWVCLGTLTVVQGEEFARIECNKAASFLAPADSADYRKYAPDRAIDILNLAIDVTPDFARRTVSGQTVLKFRPIARALPELKLDAVDLRVQSVTSTERILGWQPSEKQLTVTFTDPVPIGKEVTLTVDYSAEPTQGLYFRTPEMGYKNGDTHLFTQGEAIEARHWYPCPDAPNQKFTSDVTCRVPEGMTVLSNGRLVSVETDPRTGLRVVHWRQDKPHANYLISLVAGYFKRVEDQHGAVPLAFYVPQSQIDEAASSFRDTKDAVEFFEEDIGVPYPWAKYYQVCVNDFVAGGMENTSITTLTDSTLFTDAFENIRDSESLVAHELAHQWFGDLVTCKDWSHLWLNEGFATYYAHLYAGHKRGRDAMLYGLYKDARGIADRTDDTKPIVSRKFDSPMEQFSYLAYPKGSWILHMLRSELGDTLYRRCIKTYLERHQFGNVVTEDLNAVIEELSGRSFDRFFDQWVYHAHHPELDIRYSWDERAKLAKLAISQDQKLSDDVLLFQFPLTVRFKIGSTNLDRVIAVKEKSEDFYFALPEAPKLVRIDPNLALLAKVKFTPSDAMVDVQLKDTGDVIGRVLAVELLGTKKDHASVEKLKDVLNTDPFYGVRIDAAHALREMHSDEAFTALTNCLKQSDARVRQQVVSAATSFYRSEAYALGVQLAAQETNPDIVTVLIRHSAAFPKPEQREMLLRFLRSDSYENVLADAAVSAIRAQDDPSYLTSLQDALQEQEPNFTSRSLARGLDALAYLARNEENKDRVREFLLAYVNHRKQTVQMAAIRALGTLGDPKALAVLETFAAARKQTPQREAADQAIATVRAAKKPSDEWRDLRTEVLDLKKENRELKKQIDEISKKVDAVEKKPIEGPRKDGKEG